MSTPLIILVAVLFSAGAVLVAIEHRVHSRNHETKTRDWKKYGVYFVLLTALLWLGLFGRAGIAAVFAVVAILGGLELVSGSVSLRSRTILVLILSSTVLASCFSHLLVGPEQDWYAHFVFTVLVVSTTDSYSQLWGKLLGSRRLCPSISPGKTWEGLAGGLVSAVLVATTLGMILPQFSIARSAGIGFLLALAAVAGDLLFSIIKRRRGIKDFSTMLPAHGGVLDRFDSLVVAAPVSYWLSLWTAG